jgi:hypothetical protein
MMSKIIGTGVEEDIKVENVNDRNWKVDEILRKEPHESRLDSVDVFKPLDIDGLYWMGLYFLFLKKKHFDIKQ